MSADSPVRLKAFVGRSFLDADRAVWNDLRDLLDGMRPLGFTYEDAKESQPRPVSDKVREFIERNDIYIGLLTRRHLICNEAATLTGRIGLLLSRKPRLAWTSSEWVIEEIGYAIGRSKPTILLIEEGVAFPTSDLDADTEWIGFRRSNLAASQTQLNQMLANLLAERVSEPVDALSAVSPPSEPSDALQTPESANADFSEQLAALRTAAAAGNQEETERIQREIIDSEPDPNERQLVETFLFGERAQRGDGVALSALKQRITTTPRDIHALFMLFEAYMSFEQYGVAAALLLSNRSQVDESMWPRMSRHAALALRKDGRVPEALELLVAQFGKESNEEDGLRLWQAIADAAQDLKDTDLEAAFLERILKTNPTDNDARFRLAYLYGDLNRDRLSAYHYQLLASKVDWPGAINNLGVAYGALDLRASQIDQFLKVADKNTLSKANLANLYGAAGFLSQAEALAQDAEAARDDDAAASRARHALSEAATMREKESAIVAKIAEDTREERSFMTRYADAYRAATPDDFRQAFETPYGDLEITCRGGKISGAGSYVRDYPRQGLIAVAAGLSNPYSGQSKRRVYTLTLEGRLHGCSAAFELTISPNEAGAATTLLTSEKRQVTGLLTVDNGGQSIQCLAREDGKTKVFLAVIKA